MALFQKVYTSTSVTKISTDERNSLIELASKNNAQNEVTSILLFTGVSYLQLLEGNKDKVNQTYQSIIQDRKHSAHLIVCERDVQQRSYPDCYFLFRETDEATLQVVYALFLEDPELAIKKMNLMTEIKTSKSLEFNPERLLFYSSLPAFDPNASDSFFEFSTQVAAEEVFLMKDDSEIIYVNDSACKKLEYSADELIGKKVWQWDPLFPKEVWPGFWQDFISKQHLNFQTQHKKKSGEVFPVEIHAHLYQQKDQNFLLAFVNDISQKVQAQTEIIEYKKNLENIIQLRTEKLQETYEDLQTHKDMLDKYCGVLILDQQLNITYENEFFCKRTSTLNDTKENIYSDLKNKIKKQIDSNKQQKTCLWNGTICLADDMNHRVFFDISLFKFKKNSMNGYYLIASDTTKNHEYVEQLDIARQEAEKANKLKSQFLANMSHEIRTPMNAIMGFSQLILENEQGTAKDREYASIVMESSQELLNIINNILDLSKLEANAVKVEATQFNIFDLLKNISDIFTLEANKKLIKFKLEVEENVPSEMISSRLHIKQVLLNLVGNAIKFTDVGNVYLKVSFYPKLNELAFTVIDSGCGIENSDLEFIFNPFIQGEMRLTRRASGTGLGLAIAKKLTTLLDGQLSATSKLGEGTTFYFSLKVQPISCDIDDELQTDQNNELNQTSKIRILLAEDNKNNAALIQKFLKPNQFDIDWVTDGKMAIDALISKEYDLILMDIMMPKMDGLEATKMIRQFEDKNKSTM